MGGREHGMESETEDLESTATSTIKLLLSIVGPDYSRLDYHLPRDVPLYHLFKKYCEYKNFEYKAMVFLYKGHRVRVRRTAIEYNMEDGDEIEAVVRVVGGGSS